VHDLGIMDHDMAYEAQMSIHQTILEGDESTILFCEHPPIITCGRLTNKENIVATEEALKQKGVTQIDIDRGGDVTLHAPGQLVIYAIFDLNIFGRDLHRFLHNLEKVVVECLVDFNIKTKRHPDHTGVWVEGAKIASLGIGVKKWVSYHGIGLNVNIDLKLFELINSCGISAEVTSMEKVIGTPIEMEAVKNKIIEHFGSVFNIKNIGVTT